MKKLLMSAFLLLSANVYAGVETVTDTVRTVRYAVTTQTLSVYKTSGGYWAGNCNHVEVQLNSSFPGVKEMLTIVLMAKANGMKVRFFGDCDSATSKFVAHRVDLP